MKSKTSAQMIAGSIKALIASVALISASAAVQASGLDLQLRHQFDIPAERLETALVAFSEQAKLHVVTSAASVDAFSPGVNGNVATLDALTALLRGTGLSFRAVGGGRVEIVAATTAKTPSDWESVAGNSAQLHLTQFQQDAAMADQAAVDSDADAPAAAAAARGVQLQEVQVTGTRIIRNGYEAPTPVAVVGLQDLQDQAAANYADVLNNTPQFLGSSTPESEGTADGPGGGENNLNLRNFGDNRDLVMFDGRRVPPASANVVDVNMIPDALVERVDVVTGGASAVYGSDAVTGVVNFVLNTNFNGVQGLMQGGESGYGDGANDKLQLTVGTPFAGGRGHIEISGDQEYQAEIQGTSRPWDQEGYYWMTNPGYAGPASGTPELEQTYHVGTIGGNPGGIIMSGPLTGTAFGAGGVPFQWNYGTTQAGIYQVGGDWATSSMQGAQSLDTGIQQSHLFTDIRFNVTDHFLVFAQVNIGQNHSDDHCCYDYYQSGNLTVSAYNPYLPASVAALAQAEGVTGMTYGMTVRDPSRGLGDMDTRYDGIYTLGAKGDFSALKSTWNWNVYAQSGSVTTNEFVPYQAITANFMDAIQAVRVGTYTPAAPGGGGTIPAYTAAVYPNPLGIAQGSITCLSNLLPRGAAGETTNCVPYNVFGTGVNSQASVAYFQSGPWARFTQDENITGGAITGEPFSTWAGPVSVAGEAEYRKDAISGTNDPYSSEIGWFSTQAVAYDASEYVYEGALETVVPLVTGAPWAKELDLNGAVRATEYSVSGYANTWKYGVEYTPTTDWRIRGTVSRDIRAPTLNDLFAAPQSNHNTIPDPFQANNSYPYYALSLGNTKVLPERGLTDELGVVFQPVEVPGLGLSVDYWDIDIKGEISTVSPAYVLSQCYASRIGTTLSGTSPYCADITRFSNGTIDEIITAPQNFAEVWGKGIDYSFNYSKGLTDIVSSWKGTMGLNLSATESFERMENTGIPGPTEVQNLNGVGSLPRWSVFGTLNYNLGNWRVAWSSKYYSSLIYSNLYVDCTTNCPNPATTGLTTIYGAAGNNPNHIPSYIISNVSLDYMFHEQGSSTAEVFFDVNNVFNRDPPYYPGHVASATYATMTNTALYDLIGIAFRAGVRFKL